MHETRQNQEDCTEPKLCSWRKISLRSKPEPTVVHFFMEILNNMPYPCCGKEMQPNTSRRTRFDWMVKSQTHEYDMDFLKWDKWYCSPSCKSQKGNVSQVHIWLHLEEYWYFRSLNKQMAFLKLVKSLFYYFIKKVI